MVKSLGADKVIDYTKEDFSKSGVTYDVIFDTVDKLSRSRVKNSLKKTGVFLSSSKDSDSGGGPKTEDLLFLKKLIETKKLKSVIDTVQQCGFTTAIRPQQT